MLAGFSQVSSTPPGTRLAHDKHVAGRLSHHLCAHRTDDAAQISSPSADDHEVHFEGTRGFDDRIRGLSERLQVSSNDMPPKEMLARTSHEPVVRRPRGPDAYDRKRRPVADEIGGSIQGALRAPRSVVGDEDSPGMGCHASELDGERAIRPPKLT